MSSSTSSLRQSRLKSRLRADGGGRVPVDLAGTDLKLLDAHVAAIPGGSRAAVMRTALRALSGAPLPDAYPITLSLSDAQAGAVCDALDVFVRLGLGQLEQVSELVSMGVIPPRAEQAAPNQLPDLDRVEQIRGLMTQVKGLLGYSSGASLGVGHAHHAMPGRRAYEVYKALSQAVAMRRNPQPTFRGVHYDGLSVRYTQDAPPLVTWTPVKERT